VVLIAQAVLPRELAELLSFIVQRGQTDRQTHSDGRSKTATLHSFTSAHAMDHCKQKPASIDQANRVKDKVSAYFSISVLAASALGVWKKIVHLLIVKS